MSTDENVGNKKGYPTKAPLPIAMDYAASRLEEQLTKEKTEVSFYDHEMKNMQIAYEQQEAKRRQENSRQNWSAGQWTAAMVAEAAEANRKRLEELLGSDSGFVPDSYYSTRKR